MKWLMHIKTDRFTLPILGLILLSALGYKTAANVDTAYQRDRAFWNNNFQSELVAQAQSSRQRVLEKILIEMHEQALSKIRKNGFESREDMPDLNIG